MNTQNVNINVNTATNTLKDMKRRDSANQRPRNRGKSPACNILLPCERWKWSLFT